MFCLILILCLSIPVFAQHYGIEELKYIDIYVLTDYPHEFDLSGMVKTSDKCYMINDKRWSKYAYEFQAHENSFYLVDSIDLGIHPRTDLESVDYCEGMGMFYTDENENIAYYSGNAGVSQILFEKEQLGFDLNWGHNKGLEGLAVDCKNQVLYMAKERDPRFIASYDLKTREIKDITLKDSEGDISDLKYEDGYLYILERNENLISKMDVATNKIVARVSYKNTCSHPDGKMYEGSKYGMAEALLLTTDNIWIGLDNNGLPFSKHAEEVYGLSGNQPVIIGFERPKGF